MVEQLKNLRPWRDTVIYHARHAANGAVYSGPTDVMLTFVFPRPKNHFGSGRNANVLKPSSPYFKSSAPDIDKLVRAVLDSLVQAGMLRDDALVAQLAAGKIYGEQPGVSIAIRSI